MDLRETEFYRKPLCFYAAFISGLRKCNNLVKLEFYQEQFLQKTDGKQASILAKKVEDFFMKLHQAIHAINCVYL
jgi:hypothetical protein